MMMVFDSVPGDILKILSEMSWDTLLLLVGLAFVAVAILGNISGKISPGRGGRISRWNRRRGTFRWRFLLPLRDAQSKRILCALEFPELAWTCKSTQWTRSVRGSQRKTSNNLATRGMACPTELNKVHARIR